MSLAPKTAQLGDVGYDLDGEDVFVHQKSPLEEDQNELRMLPNNSSIMELLGPPDHDDRDDYDGHDSEIELEEEATLTLTDTDGDGDKELVLTLPHVPGGLDQEEIEEAELEVEEPKDIEISDDPWGWSVKAFLPWLSKKMQGIPSHSGRDTAGLERAIAYLERLDREISKAVRLDLDNEIAIDALEKARDEIQRGIERLEDRLEKVKSSKYPGKKKKLKKAAEANEEGLVKEGKATHVGGIVVSVPLFISYLARVLINGTVSAGHDIEDMFKKLDKKFKLTDREKAELMQLLSDMNYPVRRDRGFLVDEEIDTTSSDNFDWAANYPA